MHRSAPRSTWTLETPIGATLDVHARRARSTCTLDTSTPALQDRVMIHAPLPLDASADAKAARYTEVRTAIDSLLDGEDDWVAAMATVVSELHHAFEAYDWTGFYRAVSSELLVIGPYQGGHGCLRIPFSRGVCGAAARMRETQLVPDVHAFPDHIACSSTTLSEIVVPVMRIDGSVLAVLDVDSNAPAAFDAIDQAHLESLCRDLGARFG